MTEVSKESLGVINAPLLFSELAHPAGQRAGVQELLCELSLRSVGGIAELLCCGQDVLLGEMCSRSLSGRDDRENEDESAFWESKSGKENKPVKEKKII